MSRFKRNNRTVFNINYHIIWIPKYRRKILIGKVKNTVESALLEKSKQLGIVLEKYEIMPDHIHIFIKCNPNIKISEIVGQLKGYSSYMARKNHPKLNYIKHLYAPSYYCESIGHISEDTIKKYINDQWKVARFNRKYTSNSSHD